MMRKTIDSDVLINFLDYSGYQFYFERDPILVAGANATINTITVSELMKMVTAYNEHIDNQEQEPQV